MTHAIDPAIVERAADAMRAAGEGASELVSDAWRLVVGPVVVLGLLYLLSKG